MRLLLSIKPQHAHAILEGRKRFEFRRTIFCRAGITHVIMYSSAPQKKVVGQFTIATLLALEPNVLWNETREYAGIDKRFFDAYFAGKKLAYAIKIENPRRYEAPLDLSQHFGVARPPQSFCYVDIAMPVAHLSREVPCARNSLLPNRLAGADHGTRDHAFVEEFTA